MPDIEELLQLNHLEDKALLGLELQVAGRVFDGLFKIKVAFSRHVQRREEVRDETKEDGVVVRDNLGQVEVTQCPHQHLILRAVWIASLQGSSNHKHGFDGSQTPIIMVLQMTLIRGTIFNWYPYLLGQELLAEGVEGDELPRQGPGLEEAFGHQHDLADQAKVGHNHGARAEQGLEVLGQLGPARVPRVHRDEDPDRGRQGNFLAHEVELLFRLLDGVLDTFHLSSRNWN